MLCLYRSVSTAHRCGRLLRGSTVSFHSNSIPCISRAKQNFKYGQYASLKRRLSTFKGRFRGDFNGNNVVFAIVAANILGFTIANVDHFKTLVLQHGMVSYNSIFRQKRVHTLATSLFVHTDMMSLVFTSLGLVLMGPSIVSILGSRKFISLYFGGGLCSNLVHATMPALTRGQVRDTRHHGCSGSLTALFSWYAMTFPRSVIHLFGIVPIPAGLCGLGYAAYESYIIMTQGLQPSSGSAVGGFSFGLLFSLISRR